jgi:hypothetical protein
MELTFWGPYRQTIWTSYNQNHDLRFPWEFRLYELDLSRLLEPPQENDVPF